MSQEKPKTATKRSATEYRLSITSNPGSRRSSLSGVNESSNNGGPGTTNRLGATSGVNDEEDNLVGEYILPQIRELSDSIITLDANFTQLNFIHESLVDFNESLGALLYGLMCNSWCVDFPFVSHDISSELAVASRLESLAAEKQQLIEQLQRIKSQKKEPSKQPTFVQPVFPANQVKRINTRRPAAARHENNDDSDEDGANSEASFISNPSVELSRPSQGSVNKPANTGHDRLRRKSILHTIRNSIASTTDFQPTDEATLRRPRMSLGGGATRVLATSPPSNNFKTTPQANGHSSRVTALARDPVARDRPAATARRRTTLANRPPFR